MDERFKKLDNFLRKQLDGATEDHSWNVPDDAIFEKAMRTVADQKRKKRRGWILIPMLIGAALMVSEYFHHRQIETLQDKVIALENHLSRESTTNDLSSASTSNLQEPISTPQETTSNENKESSTSTPSNLTSPNIQFAPHPNTTKSSIISSSNTTSLDNKSTKSQSVVAQNTDASQLIPGISFDADQNQTSELATNTRSDNPAIIDPSTIKVTTSLKSDNRMTDPISTLDLKNLETQESLPSINSTIAANTTKTKLPVSPTYYGMLLGVNQSWLTMTNVPPLPDASLYNYDNSQPGFSMQGFVNKPISQKFSFQAGLGYHVYNNKSVLEDKFAFDSDNVIPMPDGPPMYQTDYNVINPIGGYNMMLEFRVSDQMNQNDMIVEYTNIEQTIKGVMLDLGVQYDLLTLDEVKVSLGTGFGLGYIAGLENEFNVSTYHNDILQKSQMETPDELNDVNKWHGQWLSNLNVGYFPNRRLGIILSARYNAGLTSIRDGGSENGPLTFLHAFGLSAGVSSSF